MAARPATKSPRRPRRIGSPTKPWDIAMLRRLALLALLLPVATASAAPESSPLLRRVVASAEAQIGTTVAYDPAYRTITFPGGDVPLDRGVCSDVLVRAYRSVGVDLQLLVNRDMRLDFAAYPNLWGLTHPDPNIDHRRVRTLAL